MPTSDSLTPRPEFNGTRLKRAEHPAIYFVDSGFKRLIPDPKTYNNLFADWTGIASDVNPDDLPDGPQMTQGAVLVCATGTDQVFLIDRGMKRAVASKAVFEKYHFGSKKVVAIPPIVLECIPLGRTISG
jgi:hypothetical protein